MLGTAVLSGREVRRSPDAVPYGPWRRGGSKSLRRKRQVSVAYQSVDFSRMPSGQMGADRGTKTSQERRSSARSCLMSFRWEVNHNREQRTPERAVRRSAVQPSSRPRENRQPSLLCSPSVQPTIAVSTVQAFRSWSSSTVKRRYRSSLRAPTNFVCRSSAEKVRATSLFLTVRLGASSCISKSAA